MTNATDRRQENGLEAAALFWHQRLAHLVPAHKGSSEMKLSRPSGHVAGSAVSCRHAKASASRVREEEQMAPANGCCSGKRGAKRRTPMAGAREGEREAAAKANGPHLDFDRRAIEPLVRGLKVIELHLHVVLEGKAHGAGSSGHDRKPSNFFSSTCTDGSTTSRLPDGLVQNELDRRDVAHGAADLALPRQTTTKPRSARGRAEQKHRENRRRWTRTCSWYRLRRPAVM